MRRLHVIGAPTSAGAHAPGQERGPEALRAAGLRRKRLSALLGHVAEPPAGLGVDRPAAPADLAAVGSSTPSTIRMAVVLPAPLGPTNPNIWPSATVNERSSNATTTSP
jgi:hypothetical protein